MTLTHKPGIAGWGLRDHMDKGSTVSAEAIRASLQPADLLTRERAHSPLVEPPTPPTAGYRSTSVFNFEEKNHLAEPIDSSIIINASCFTLSFGLMCYTAICN